MALGTGKTPTKKGTKTAAGAATKPKAPSKKKAALKAVSAKKRAAENKSPAGARKGTEATTSKATTAAKVGRASGVNLKAKVSLGGATAKESTLAGKIQKLVPPKGATMEKVMSTCASKLDHKKAGDEKFIRSTLLWMARNNQLNIV